MDHRRDGSSGRRTLGDRNVLTDVLVLGGGPSGRAAAYRLAGSGVGVTLIDRHPDRRWVNTYGTWTDELPDWLPQSVRATTVANPVVVGTRRHVVGRQYTVLDTPRLQQALSHEDITTVAGEVGTASRESATLIDGSVISADHVIDARGSAVGPGIPEQTAHGIVMSREAASAAMDGASTLVMDWRQDNGSEPGSTPSFLYAVPLDLDTVLLEETCLIGRPGLSGKELSRRLFVRLAARGVSVAGDEPIERVRFAMRAPTERVQGALTTGTRSPALHPATGYSVAASLRRADRIVDTLTADASVDSAGGRGVAALRSIGANALLSFPGDALAPFFDHFFDMPEHKQRAYLSSDDDVIGLSRAMLTLFSHIDTADRRVILGAVRRTVWSATSEALASRR
ncbi:MAG: lycopene cyclase family protein [Rhodococcus sp. (in: high G+C Gram-positive bacteria)]